MRPALAVPGHLFVRPLVQGLDRPDSPFTIAVDLPAKNALAFNERAGDLRCAFLSPIDYARHGAEYCIVPGIGVSASAGCGIVRLLIKSNVRNIRSVAVDIRVTSEILLAKIILVEKYRNVPSQGKDLVFLPMLPDPDVMLQKADAALIVSFEPAKSQPSTPDVFVLDLVEEWVDLTDLPYVFGFWVGREEHLTTEEAKALVSAKETGLRTRERVIHDLAISSHHSLDAMSAYFASLSYDLGEREEEALAEFFHYAYFHGALPDVPEVQYFDLG